MGIVSAMLAEPWFHIYLLLTAATNHPQKTHPAKLQDAFQAGVSTPGDGGVAMPTAGERAEHHGGASVRDLHQVLPPAEPVQGHDPVLHIVCRCTSAYGQFSGVGFVCSLIDSAGVWFA